MVDVKMMIPVFLSVFLAELGDKTQIATMTFVASGTLSRFEVFIAASLALVVSTFLGVMAGALVGRLVNPSVLKTIAGFIFIVMGVWTVYHGLKG
ncbi:MAG: TMEM165/GDT1 family protein [Deltaproteobacteria bacterium]|jgi:putative Ca2+/H+ antiporter (TMEM165/GDT1 family)|nr:TMEM165/GDT1 family protein [Deltaproteobacteria bacterium]